MIAKVKGFGFRTIILTKSNNTRKTQSKVEVRRKREKKRKKLKGEEEKAFLEISQECHEFEVRGFYFD